MSDDIMRQCKACLIHYSPEHYAECPECFRAKRLAAQQSALGQQQPGQAQLDVGAAIAHLQQLRQTEQIQRLFGQSKGQAPKEPRGQGLCPTCGVAGNRDHLWGCVATRERDALRARVAELETDRREMEAARHTDYEQRDALRKRVAELEAEFGRRLEDRLAAEKLGPAHLAEDLRRKREECLSLETRLADYRRQSRITVEERDDARHCLGAAQAEVARLRRELGRKR